MHATERGPLATQASKTALGGAVKLVVRTFLEPGHYQKLHRCLSERWVAQQSLAAAARLMEGHCIKISPEEERRLSALGEEQLIEALVHMMPKGSQEHFEHFFLQLQLIVSTTTRLGAALQEGNAAAMEGILDSADDVGITPYILKMAVVQAGTEVRALEQSQDLWIAKSEKNMGPLLRGQEDSMFAMMQLAEARAQLANIQGDSKDKSRKVLMAQFSGQEKAMQGTIFGSWNDHVKRMRVENEIRKEYEDRIYEAENRLIDYRTHMIENVRNVLMRDAAKGDAELLTMCIATWKEDANDSKTDREHDVHVRELEAKLSSFASGQADKTKQVLQRMNADNDSGLIGMMWGAWMQWSVDYKKNRGQEDAVKSKEAQVKDFINKQKDSAKGVLDRMSGSNETGIKYTFLTSWFQVAQDEKKANEFKNMLNESQGMFASFSARNSQNANGCMGRAADLQDLAICMQVFHPWKCETKVERHRRYGRARHDMRKNQIQSVKGLFKNFANDLDGLRMGDETPAGAQTDPAAAQTTPSKARSESQKRKGKSSPEGAAPPQ